MAFGKSRKASDKRMKQTNKEDCYPTRKKGRDEEKRRRESKAKKRLRRNTRTTSTPGTPRDRED